MSVHPSNSKTYDSRGRLLVHTHDSVANQNDIVYITGDDFNDGSIRLILGDDSAIANIESRDDVFNDTGIRVASLSIGRDMDLSAIAGFLETFNPSAVVGHQRAIVPHIPFDDLTGTTFKQLHIPIANDSEMFVIFSTAVGEVTGTVLGQIIADSPRRIITSSIHEIGATSATDDVKVRWYVGTDNTGTLFNRKTFPASDFAAGTLTIDYDDDLGLDAGVSYFQEFTSDSDISLQTDIGGNILATHVGHELDELTGVSENLYYDQNLGLILDQNLNPIYANQF